MAYRVDITKQSNTEEFFNTTLQLPELLLSSAVVNIQANSSGSFDFTIPPTHAYYNELTRLTTYFDVYRDDDANPIFTGRIYQITDLMKGFKQVSCEGAMAYFSDSILRPAVYQCTLKALVEAILANHNSQVEAEKQITLGTFTVDNSNVYREYLNYEASIVRLKDLRNTFGGYMMLRKTGGVLYLDWLDSFTDACTQQVMLSSNMLDFNRKIASNSVCTVLIPLGAKDSNGNRITIKSVNDGEDYITASSEYLNLYGYVTKVVIFDDVHEPSILLTKAQNYLTAATTVIQNITVKAVDLADAGYDVDNFRVGQKIAVYSEFHEINDVFYDCIQQRLDLLNPTQNTLDLGAVQSGYIQSQHVSEEKTLAAIAEGIEQSQTEFQRAIAAANQVITGNAGGYVVLHDADGDTAPDEILILDTPSIDTAVKVWRFNNAGLAFSSTGYNGVYETAITMAGGIVGSFLTAESINTEKLAAGAVTAEKIHSNTITADKLAAGAESIINDNLIDNILAYPFKQTTMTAYGITWTDNGDGTITVNGTSTGTTQFILENTQPIPPGIYTFSGGTENIKLSKVAADITHTDSGTGITFQLSEAADLQMYYTVYSGQTFNNVILKPMLCRSSIVKEWKSPIHSIASQFIVTDEEIASKVSQTDYNGNTIASLINQTATTIAINASKINLTGYITATDLQTSGQTVINGGNITTGNIKIGGSSGNTDGGIFIYDASDNLLVRLNKDGLYLGSDQYISANNVQGGTLELGKYNNASGELFLYDQNDKPLSRLDNEGLTFYAYNGNRVACTLGNIIEYSNRRIHYMEGLAIDTHNTTSGKARSIWLNSSGILFTDNAYTTLAEYGTFGFAIYENGTMRISLDSTGLYFYNSNGSQTKVYSAT